MIFTLTALLAPVSPEIKKKTEKIDEIKKKTEKNDHGVSA